MQRPLRKSSPTIHPNQHIWLRASSKHSLSSSSSGLCPLPWAARSMPTTLWCRPFPLPPAAPPLAQLHSVPSGPVTVRAELSAAPPLPVRSCSRHEASPQLLCSALSMPRDLNCCTYVVYSRPFTIIVALLWMLLNSLMPFLYSGAKPAPSGGGEAAQHRTEQTIPPLAWGQCWAWCSPGCGWPFWLPGHTAGLSPSCCQP